MKADGQGLKIYLKVDVNVQRSTNIVIHLLIHNHIKYMAQNATLNTR